MSKYLEVKNKGMGKFGKILMVLVYLYIFALLGMAIFANITSDYPLSEIIRYSFIVTLIIAIIILIIAFVYVIIKENKE